MRLPLKMMTAAAALLLTSVAAQAQIKIGAVLSVTGGASFLGDPEKKTLEMYVADINAKGGIAGKKIELVIYDDASDPEPGAHVRHAADRAGQGRRAAWRARPRPARWRSFRSRKKRRRR